MSSGRRKQGLIFSLDAALAVTVIVIMLINSTYFFSTSSKEALSQLQLSRTGSDIMGLIANKPLPNEFTTIVSEERDLLTGWYQGSTPIDPPFIEAYTPDIYGTIGEFLPANYQYKIQISDIKETNVNTNTVTQGNAFCDATKCTLAAGQEVKIDTFFLEEEATRLIRLFINAQGNALSPIAIKVTNDNTGSVVTLTNSVYLGGSLGGSTASFFVNLNAKNQLVSKETLEFERGINTLTIRNDASISTIDLYWFRVLSDPAYAKTTGDPNAVTQDLPLPQDRFIGTGMRFFSVLEDDLIELDLLGTLVYYPGLEGHHWVRYWIWLKE